MSYPIEKATPTTDSPQETSDVERCKSNEKNSEQSQQPTAERQKWYQWFAPTDTPAERRLIPKLDGLIIVFLFLAHWAKVLDSSATSTAYVSGFACTIPIAFLGLCLLPSTPDRCNSRYLTQDEIRLAQERMAAEHREPRQPFTIPRIITILKGWRIWILVGFAFFFSQADGVSSNSGLSLWLKAENYSVESINTITTVSPAVTIVASIVCGVISDIYDAKVSLIAITALLNIFACLVLAIWNVPVGLKFFAFFLSGTADGIAAIIYAWANEICARSAEERALVISAMNTIGNTFGAWIPLL
ncbi:unnamed protein product [Aspergillus oryzae]|nr:unnamed protein product [Aspergillus oryzae]